MLAIIYETSFGEIAKDKYAGYECLWGVLGPLGAFLTPPKYAKTGSHREVNGCETRLDIDWYSQTMWFLCAREGPGQGGS